MFVLRANKAQELESGSNRESHENNHLEAQLSSIAELSKWSQQQRCDALTSLKDTAYDPHGVVVTFPKSYLITICEVDVPRF
jgi:hypothetical protein